MNAFIFFDIVSNLDGMYNVFIDYIEFVTNNIIIIGIWLFILKSIVGDFILKSIDGDFILKSKHHLETIDIL